MPEKCAELGVPAGPLYGKLKAGKDITLECGRIIRAESVRSADEPGPVFLVVDCPEESYLDNFIANPKLGQFHVSNSLNNVLKVVVHFTPNEVVYSIDILNVYSVIKFIKSRNLEQEETF